MENRDYLFSGIDWISVNIRQKQQMAIEIESIEANRLLNSSIDDLARYFYEKYQVVVPELDVSNLEVDEHETKIDVRHDPMRRIMYPHGPFYITGTEVTVEVPFTGDAEAFKIQPNPYTLSPPNATIQGAQLTFSVAGSNLDRDSVRREIDRTVASIQSYLTTLRANVAGFNNSLHGEAKSAIEARRIKLLASKNMVASLGFKVKERADSVKTYIAPEICRKVTPVMPAASSAQYNPEPTLSTEDYDHILSVMQGMTQVMERSPSAFLEANEETLRSHFLVQLNGHYLGQATGETFNYEGKTDILIRSDGKNIFIGECKFWSGPKRLSETIDQLLSYSSWRDTKTAIIIFNRNREFSKVLASIPKTVQAHPQYKSDLPNSSETVFRYRVANRDDQNRELYLTVLAFDIPTTHVP
jgi:hypothetical protein